MNQVEIAESRFFAGLVLKEQSFRGESVSTGNGIVARIGDGCCTVPFELIRTELEQPDIRSSPLLRVEARLDLGDGFHEAEIQAESIRGAFNFLDRCPDGNAFHRFQSKLGRLLVRWNLGKSVISET